MRLVSCVVWVWCLDTLYDAILISFPPQVDDCGCVNFYMTNIADVGCEEVCVCGHKRSEHRDLEAKKVDDEDMRRTTYKLYGLDESHNHEFEKEIQERKRERELATEQQRREEEKQKREHQQRQENANQGIQYIDGSGVLVTVGH